MFHPPPGLDDEARISEKPIPAPKLPAKLEANPDGLAPNCLQGDELYIYVNECFDNGSTKNEVFCVFIKIMVKTHPGTSQKGTTESQSTQSNTEFNSL